MPCRYFRSSLRKPKSPRSPGSTPAATGPPAANDKSPTTETPTNPKSAIEIMRKSVKPATAKLNGGGGGMVREKSNVTSYRSTQQRNGGSVSSKTTLTATTTNKQSVIKSPSKQLSGSSAAAAASVYASPKRTPSAEYINGSRGGSAGSYNRRLTTTLSPEESKMISHFEKEVTI